MDKPESFSLNPKKQFRHSGYILLFALLLVSCGGPKSEPGTAGFHWFEYQGQDALHRQVTPGPGEVANPILQGFYPDPSICRKGSDYYMVNSTFSWFPGVPVFHSRDLKHWQQIGHVLERPSQLDLDGLGVSEGIFAPAIQYNPANETFYMITTLVGKGGNFVVTAKDPSGPWSDPVWLNDIHGIDPSIFFDDDGKAWIVYNSGPDYEPLYDGHRAIRLVEFDAENLTVPAPGKVVVDGGVDISQKPVWVEGPHLYKVNGTYYLMAAEGGTSEYHSEVIFTSDVVTGPYKPAKINPILTQRDLPADRPDPITSTGHADLIDTPSGDWYAVFLGCRPYTGNHYNTGRETFLSPVTWTEGIPVIVPAGETVPWIVTVKEDANVPEEALRVPTGNFTVRDEFEGDKPALTWNMLRTPRENWFALKDGELQIRARDVSIRERQNPSMLARRQQHGNFTATTELTFTPAKAGQSAGITCFQNERHMYSLSLKEDNGKLKVVLDKSAVSYDKAVPEAIAVAEKELKPGREVWLQVKGTMPYYHFSFSTDGINWQQVGDPQDATYLSTASAGGFVGVYIGLFAE